MNWPLITWSNNSNVAAYDTTSGTGTTARTAWITKVAATLPGVTAGGTNSPTIAVTTVVRKVRAGRSARRAMRA